MATLRIVPIITGGVGGVLTGVVMGFLLEKDDRGAAAGWLLGVLHKPVETTLVWIADTFYPHNHDQAMVFILPVLLSYWLLIGVLLGGVYCLAFRKRGNTEGQT